MSETVKYEVNISTFVPAGGDVLQPISQGGQGTDEPLEIEEWKSNGKISRLNGPAITIRGQKSGTVLRQEWFVEGERHRIGAPAFVEEVGDQYNEIWFQRDCHHRIGGPATLQMLKSNGVIRGEIWAVKGQMHRLEGPSSIIRDCEGAVSDLEYYQDGMRHRENGPAIISYSIAFNDSESSNRISLEEWYYRGKLHREGGFPALIRRDPTGKTYETGYFENGIQVTPSGPSISI